MSAHTLVKIDKRQESRNFNEYFNNQLVKSLSQTHNCPMVDRKRLDHSCSTTYLKSVEEELRDSYLLINGVQRGVEMVNCCYWLGPTGKCY